MASFSRKTGIIGALVIAGVFIVGSLVLSGAINLSLLNPSGANAAGTQALLQAYASRDSDHDGLPDWEEALYGLDPNNPHSFSPNMTDGEAVARGLVKPKFLSETTDASSTDGTDNADEPDGITATADSVTNQFSQYLLTQYVNQAASNSSDGTQESDADIATFAQGAIQTFAQSHAQQDVYALGQVQVGGTGPDALKAYAAATEEVFSENNTDGSENEIDYFTDAIEKNDPTDLAQVAAIGKAYTNMAPALMEVKVPTEAQFAHLEIANAASRLGGDITDLSMMNTDPLRAYLGLEQYQTDATSLANGFANLSAVFADEQVSFTEGDPGYYVWTTAQQAQAAASTTPN